MMKKLRIINLILICLLNMFAISAVYSQRCKVKVKEITWEINVQDQSNGEDVNFPKNPDNMLGNIDINWLKAKYEGGFLNADHVIVSFLLSHQTEHFIMKTRNQVMSIVGIIRRLMEKE